MIVIIRFVQLSNNRYEIPDICYLKSDMNKI